MGDLTALFTYVNPVNLITSGSM